MASARKAGFAGGFFRLALGAAALIAVAEIGCGAGGARSSGAGVPSGVPLPVGPIAGTSGTPSPTPVAPTLPIVLLPGLGAFATAGSAGYFAGIPEALRADGWQVFTPTVDPFQAVSVRAGQDAASIDAILAQTGASRVHVIAHSQGGLDARYLISTLGYGDRIATLTTLGTPHHGSKVSDLALGLIPGNAGDAMAAVFDAFFGAVVDTSENIQAALTDLSESWVDGTFNPANPDDPRVAYYSVEGVTQPFANVDTSVVSVCDPALQPSWWIDAVLEGSNDGIVATSSARWAHDLGTIPADHFGETDGPAGVAHPAFDAIAFYRELAAFVEGQGPAPHPQPPG